MAETLARFFVDLFQDKIPPELTIFVISLMPILELRGGMIAARLLEVNFFKAFAICFVGNMLPIPFILLFITPIFDRLKKTKLFRPIVEKLEARAMGKSDQIQKSLHQEVKSFYPIKNNIKH